MRRHEVTKLPVASFRVPPARPEPVEQAYARFDDVAMRWARLRTEIEEAKEAVARAKAAETRGFVDAVKAGDKPPKALAAATAKAEALVQELQTRLAPVAVAVDELGNELAEAIDAHRDAIDASYRELEAAAAADFDRAIAEAKRAQAELGVARSARLWLARFSLTDAVRGRQQPWNGNGNLTVKAPEFTPGFSTGAIVGVATVLDVAALATAAPSPPPGRRSRPPAEEQRPNAQAAARSFA